MADGAMEPPIGLHFIQISKNTIWRILLTLHTLQLFRVSVLYLSTPVLYTNQQKHLRLHCYEFRF